MRLWAKIKRNHRTVAQAECALTHFGDWDVDSLHAALEDICKDLDLARPVILGKHVREINKFSRTSFKKADFIEKINYDALEIEIINEEKAKPGFTDISK